MGNLEDFEKEYICFAVDVLYGHSSAGLKGLPLALNVELNLGDCDRPYLYVIPVELRASVTLANLGGEVSS